MIIHRSIINLHDLSQFTWFNSRQHGVVFYSRDTIDDYFRFICIIKETSRGFIVLFSLAFVFHYC